MKKYIFVFIIFAFILFGLYFYVFGVKKLQSNIAVSSGEMYISKMYGEYAVLGKSCQGEDTDGDTYVSCDFRIKRTSSSEERVLHLQCPTMWKSITGSVCKEYRFVIPQQ